MPCAILLDHCSKTADKAKVVAERLHLPLVTEITHKYGAYLVWQEEKLGCLIPTVAQKPYCVDFLSDNLSYRQQQAKKELIVRACQIKSLDRPVSIIDATAGFGRDSFILAASGAAVTMLERNPIVAALLEDGLARLKGVYNTPLNLIKANAIEYFEQLDKTTCPDVIYLDPMFEEERNAKVKKDLQILQWLLAQEKTDAAELFESAYATSAKRIVVKRAIHAPTISAQKPSFILSGKHTRFDVYCR